MEPIRERLNLVLDVSGIAQNPKVFDQFSSFGANNIYVPAFILDILSEMIKDSSQEKSAYIDDARKFLYWLGTLNDEGNLWEGIQLKSGGTIRIYDTSNLRFRDMDETILFRYPPKVGIKLTEMSSRKNIMYGLIDICKRLPGPTVLVSNDPVQRIYAKKEGVKAESPYDVARHYSGDDSI